jgi:hypothetical protein
VQPKCVCCVWFRVGEAHVVPCSGIAVLDAILAWIASIHTAVRIAWHALNSGEVASTYSVAIGIERSGPNPVNRRGECLAVLVG